MVGWLSRHNWPELLTAVPGAPEAVASHAHGQRSAEASLLHVPTVFKTESADDAAARATALRQKAVDLQKVVDAVGKEWSEGAGAVDDASKQVSALVTQRNKSWEKHSVGLDNICRKLRDLLDSTATARRLCQKAQEDDQSGLPALFRKRAKDSKRFSAFQGGRINGCAEAQIDGTLSAVPCKCVEGLEESGCKDAHSPQGHQLLCTQVFNHRFNQLDLSDFFAVGGPCSIGSSSEINQPTVPSDAFSAVAKASAVTPEFFAFFESPLLHKGAVSSANGGIGSTRSRSSGSGSSKKHAVWLQ
mmetsp:Transcript_128279/g.256206  ORF Transcript_128279/g.256206 Transcript_128279/m.256206 type:complete len:302 (-) Transcript_128279:262-1167(-)